MDVLPTEIGMSLPLPRKPPLNLPERIRIAQDVSMNEDARVTGGASMVSSFERLKLLPAVVPPRNPARSGWPNDELFTSIVGDLPLSFSTSK